MHRARKRRAYISIEGKIRNKRQQKKEGSEHASAGKDCSTRGACETEGGTCGGSDLLTEKREERVWTCRVRVGEGSATWL